MDTVRGAFELVEPKIIPTLDEGFRPAVLANRAYLRELEESGDGVPLTLGLERANGSLSRVETRVFPEDHPRARASLSFSERMLKFLLWQRGAWRVYVGGPRSIGQCLKSIYSAEGVRSFDYHFMGDRVYQRPFTVVSCSAEEVPAERERTRALGRHSGGSRIGFDLGASDLKVSAVVDGTVIYAEEIVWEPAVQTDPRYHYTQIQAALRRAQARMARLDAVGGSSAGVYVDNRPMIASLYRGIAEERFDEIRNLFLRIRDEFGVPLEVVNDGEVAALAGSMSLEENCVLGIALGSSEAAGYVNSEGHITDWLNELAFAPVDYSPSAPVDEWSGDKGVGALYLSQQCVFRLAPRVGIELPETVTKAAQLEYAQDELEAGHSGAAEIWQTMGTYLGYALLQYAGYYELKHVLILGRCTSGTGGAILLDGAKEVLSAECPELADRINLQLPDEKSRRVGQAVAAASLPSLD